MPSLWQPEPPEPRPSLPHDIDVDVAIVGAGFTGLWTAYALKRNDPSVRVAICERDFAGFGASGRNGGWCSAFFAGSTEHAMRPAMIDTLDEIETTITKEGIDCDWARGGTVSVATTPAHVARLQADLEDDERWLDPIQSRALINCAPNLGGRFSPHCAAIHPFKLVRGLAAVVESRGVPIYERTNVTAIEPGRVVTSHGTVRADVVVRATEAFTPGRAYIPIYSLMIATEPLSSEFWADAGLAERATFTDGRHMIIYGQRTADDRIAFGGRGTPYHFGSRIEPAFDTHARVHAALERTLRGLFPKLGDAKITHRWGGAVAVPRDWQPSVGFDRATGMAWAGGYVGDGVATTNLAGRTLADLITGNDSDLVHLPWVDHRSPRWEPEPWRWLGVNGARVLIESIDRAEARGRRPKRRLRLAGRLVR
ncbi:MAG TPA: FAD-dependent oxidoreductase [Acidimicrobiia bacterium]|nr:FAD-dependent oxidoreductase [Acidimicrobiia bacterium]